MESSRRSKTLKLKGSEEIEKYRYLRRWKEYDTTGTWRCIPGEYSKLIDNVSVIAASQGDLDCFQRLS